MTDLNSPTKTYNPTKTYTPVETCTSVDSDPPIDLATFVHPAIHRINNQYWFQEKSDHAFPGQAFSLQIDQVLHHTHSQFQDILIFKSKSFGNVLVLNGIIQCTEKDEFAYQEMITNLPIMSHRAPKKVLVIGGGDCGVVRELVKHLDQGVDEITMVEIDDMVIRLLARYLPTMAKFHNHPRVRIVIDDGFKYLKAMAQPSIVEQSSAESQEIEKYDVIITDSSDPEGPAQEFFQVGYFELLANALKRDGIVIMQSSENVWLNLPYLKELMDKAKQVFGNVRYSQCYMPSYTSGQLGLIIATNDKAVSLEEPRRVFSQDQEARMFSYYSAEVHRASFVLPAWASRFLGQ